MRTQLSQFCKHFDTTVRPMLAPLGALVEALQNAEPDTPSIELWSELGEVRHQLGTLCDKVVGQQAYVLIFGPLKSGKSTLMNALAGSYVSEVSSLPAYPCLVFVGHGPRREFVVTEYRGGAETYTDSGPLHDRIHAAHLELAGAIRATEESGEMFDPAEHFAAAIRRVDVRLPAPNLAATGAVLVDTPGLYTRMRFGYDRMTRDFRNAAACAIFVVKSDTLFLEQVFTEFDQLLELFSRIFLVVNMDTQKRDLGPDGKLIPSLEQRSPETIIEAFENFAMTAPLKQAALAGRVRIYPADLMNAASVALQQQIAAGAGDQKDRKATNDDRLPLSFVKFRDELTEYLASSDYLVAFLGDSLQRAYSLVLEASELTDGDEASQLRELCDDVERRREACQDELDRIGACLARDWRSAFARFDADVVDEVERASRDQSAKVARAMDAAIDTWFLSSHSLDWLMRSKWSELARDYCDDVQRAALRCFEQSNAQNDAGLQLEPDVVHLLRSVGIDLRTLRQAALTALGDPTRRSDVSLSLDYDEIPIRRGMLDLVTFRSVDAVRQRLFGAKDAPDLKIPSKTKMARLGEAAKHYMREALLDFRKGLFQTTVDKTIERFRDELRLRTVDELQNALRSLEPAGREALAQLDGDRRRLRAVLEPMDRARAAAADVAQKVHALSKQYAATHPEVLVQSDAELPLGPGQVLTPRAAKRPELRRRRRSEHGA